MNKSKDKSELSAFQRSVGKWGKKTFNHDDHSLYSLWHHLEKETKELAGAIADFMGQAMDNVKQLPDKPQPLDRKRIADELADCHLLLLNIAHLTGVDLGKASRAKMEINRKRKRGEPDKDGVIEHR